MTRDRAPISHRTSLLPGTCPVMVGFFAAQGCNVVDSGCLLTRLPFEPDMSTVPHRAGLAANWSRLMVEVVLRRTGLDNVARMAHVLPIILDGATALEVAAGLRKVALEVGLAVLTRAIEGGCAYEAANIAADVVQHAIDAAVLAERIWTIGGDVERSHAADDLGYAVGKVALQVTEDAQLEFLETMRTM